MAEPLPKTDWIWHDGELVPWKAATIHVMSHVVHYGSSIFEGIRCYHTPAGPAIFRLRDHMRRFRDSCKIYRMEPEHDIDALMEACAAVVRRNRLTECYIRPVALRGFGAAGVSPTASPIETYVVCWPWGAYLGAEALERGVDVCVSSWQRPQPNTFPALAKAGANYMNAQLIKMEAMENGYAEAIALSPDGLVSEGSGQNLFLVRDGTLYTPSPDGSLLPGITRDSVLTLAREADIPVREQAIPREMLYVADELFFTGTAAEITPIRSVDRVAIGGGRAGPVTKALQQRLLAVARGGAADPYGWRTLVETPAKKVVA